MSTSKNKFAATTSTTQPARRPLTGFFTVMGFVVLGVVVSTVLEGGGTNWLWLGCGVGAGMGVSIAQRLGYWPKKQGR